VRCGFHAYKSVAPLKPAKVYEREGKLYAEFPRLQKRGPIEASS